jgi:hypothetical protein
MFTQSCGQRKRRTGSTPAAIVARLYVAIVSLSFAANRVGEKSVNGKSLEIPDIRSTSSLAQYGPSV